MWKVALAFVVHRLALLATIFVILNASLPHSPGRTSKLPEIHSKAQLWQEFLKRVSRAPAYDELKRLSSLGTSQVLLQSKSPYLWMATWFMKALGLSVPIALILLSNVFALLFLTELNALFNRMVTPDVAASSSILLLLWPTSVLLSLGGGFSFICFLTTIILRGALDNQWLPVGVSLSLLAMTGPFALGLIPFLLFVFWYYQRHFKLSQVIRRGLYFLLPLGAALYFAWPTYPHWREILSSSVLSSLYHNVSFRGNLHSDWAGSLAGQWITLLFIVTGAISAFFSNAMLFHRLAPVYMGLLLLAFSQWGNLVARAPLAAICFEGVTSLCSMTMLRWIQVILFGSGLYEAAAMFR